MPHPRNNPNRADNRFLVREDDGSVRIRVRFTGDVATLIEEAAGELAPVKWIEATIEKEARRVVRERRQGRKLPPATPPPPRKKP